MNLNMALTKLGMAVTLSYLVHELSEYGVSCMCGDGTRARRGHMGQPAVEAYSAMIRLKGTPHCIGCLADCASAAAASALSRAGGEALCT
jgi:hypothetical protein